jgi:hypothetical protein
MLPCYRPMPALLTPDGSIGFQPVFMGRPRASARPRQRVPSDTDTPHRTRGSASLPARPATNCSLEEAVAQK